MVKAPSWQRLTLLRANPWQHMLCACLLTQSSEIAEKIDHCIVRSDVGVGGRQQSSIWADANVRPRSADL